MKEIELISKRGKREKHFLQKDGSIIAKMYFNDIHFFKNGKYEEIDNHLYKVGNYYKTMSNSFDAYFSENSVGNILKYVLNENDYLMFEILNINMVKANLINTSNKLIQKIDYNNIFSGVDLEYCISSNKIKENFIIKSTENMLNEVKFKIKTNLDLQLNNGKQINVLKNNKNLLVLDIPYMVDQNGQINNNNIYKLEHIENYYILTLKLDKDWLCDKDRKYPVLVDPTISAPTNDVQNTFICPSDAYANTKPYEMYDLSVGINDSLFSWDYDTVREPNRTLLKFSLPTIGTGSQVINATLSLVNYVGFSEFIPPRRVDIHRITKDWTERTASWNSMNDNYDSRIEATSECTSGVGVDDEGKDILYHSTWDVTTLVKEWYSGVSNYGMMLKTHDEIDNGQLEPAFFSSRYPSDGTFLYPMLEISYRNQTGLENYMDYQTQTFASGYVCENIYNGNLTANFDLNNTIGSKLPTQLSLVYNTNDVVLNKNYGYGKGFKLNFQQYIKKVTINNIEYLEYLDSDGTLHYFLNTGTEYKDEDGLNMTIKEENDNYILTLEDSSEMKFQKVDDSSRLIEYKDFAENVVNLNYNDNGLLCKLVDSDNKEININYSDDEISVISSTMETRLYYSNGKLIKIDTIDGETCFEYNNLELISKIIDVSGTSIEYAYYEQSPYKVKRVTEKGSNDSEGQYFSLEYGNNLTIMTDQNNNVIYVNFNDLGNPITRSVRKGKNILNGALATINTYGLANNPDYKNKLLSMKMPSGYVNNYLSNTSFEGDNINFLSTLLDLSIVSDFVYDGNQSLKMSSHNAGESCYQDISVPKGRYYTFSAYLKNDVICRLSLSYTDNNGELVEEMSEEIFVKNEFARNDVTIFYPNTAISPLRINIYLQEVGNVYMDNIQLENGQVASEYNYVENSNFINGFDGWNLLGGKSDNGSFSIVDLPENEGKALRIEMDPELSTSVDKEFNVHGKKGDEIVICFWYKNNGIITDMYNSAIVSFDYIKEVPYDTEPISLNPSKDQWQFFSTSYVAGEDYNKITLSIFQQDDANDLYITNVSLYKNIKSIYYDYDSNGNIITSTDVFGNVSGFKYDRKNQLINMSDSMGKTYSIETDNNINRNLSLISDSGISSKIRYDSTGNMISTKIMRVGIEGEISDGIYAIRSKGTNRYLSFVADVPKMQNQYNNPSNWVLEKKDDFFEIKHPLLFNKYLTIDNDVAIFTDYKDENSLFDLIKNDNGSYMIKCKSNDNYLKINGENIELSTYIQDDNALQFYFETVDNYTFIENDAEYDGNLLKNVTDERLNKKVYIMDVEKGLPDSVIDEKGDKIEYNYSKHNELIKLKKNNRVVNFNYTDGCNLKTVNQDEHKYSFDYDEFANVSKIIVGNKYNILTNVYGQHNGNIMSVIYGNGQITNYEYDNFDRITHIKKENNDYEFMYNSNGNLAKKISNDKIEKFYYDLGHRLMQYNDGSFMSLYNYDKNSNIVEKKYRFNTVEHNIKNTYNSEDAITSSEFDNHKIVYNYNSLGMLENAFVDNNKLKKEYSYITNGNRISTLIKNVNVNGHMYLYKYDKLKNLTHLYCDDKLINRYYYDEYNQLIREDNYLLNRTIRYKYDNYGNMIYRTEFKLNSYEYIKQDKFNYENNNWKHQLTKINNVNITYDDVGNPLNYGNDVIFSWTAGKELSNYKNISKNLNVYYKYNSDGIRTYKNVNGKETQYYLEGNNIIYENIDGNLVYFIRNETDDLLGFIYNDAIYFYEKNEHEDIIGILDSNYKEVAKYSYDSWGNILSITDGYGNDCSNEDNHIANINPFRYRSYYYDKETKMYYLNSRYYCPSWYRFINADNIIMQNRNVSGNNLYLYGDNNPVNFIDPDGHGILSWIKETAKKVVNGAKKAVKMVKNAIKSAGKTIKNTVKKAINFANNFVSGVSNFINDVKNSFTFEAGLGFGLSGGAGAKVLSHAEIGFYEDYSIKIESGQISTGSSISFSASASLRNKEYGLDDSIWHSPHHAQNYSQGGISYNMKHTNPFPSIIDLWDCDESEWSKGGTISLNDNRAISADDSGNIFIGIDLDLHIGIGGHLKIGFTL